MFARVVSHLRSNVIGYFALFVALGGTATAVVLPRNTVSSRSIINGQVKRVDIARNAVNHTRIRDVERAIQIPLGSFADCESVSTGRDLDWTEDADTNADRYIASNLNRVIRWDATTGSRDNDSTVCSEFMVPPDAVAPVGLRVSAATQQSLGPTVEQITGNVTGRTETVDLDGGTAVTLYEFDMADMGFTPGETQRVSVTAHGANNAELDDAVHVHSVAFVYKSGQ